MDRHDLIWNPWHGCHRYSEGCANCYAFFLDQRYGRDTSQVSRNKTDFDLPLKKNRAKEYRLPGGSHVRVCMASDFFIEEADPWRDEAWDIIRQRRDLMFSLLTKRAQRIQDHLPADWGEGWDNVTFAVSCENEQRLRERIPYLLAIPAKHRWISLKPFIGPVSLDEYLASGKIEWVLAGGESYRGNRPLNDQWVLNAYKSCVRYGVSFTFAQTGNVYIQNGIRRQIYNRTEQMTEAVKSGWNYPSVDIAKEVKAIENEAKAKRKR